jgi:hypothetical protein
VGARSNIAEGFPCSHAKYARFLEIASRSLEEIEDRLIEMTDEGLVTKADLEPAMRLKIRTSRAIAKLRAYLLSTPDPPSYSRVRERRRPRTYPTASGHAARASASSVIPGSRS